MGENYESVTKIFSRIFHKSFKYQVSEMVNAESIFYQIECDIQILQQILYKKMYHYIYLTKKLVFEIFLEIIVFARMKPP